MYKRNSKLTRVEISHNLDQEIFYEFKKWGSVSSDFYEDRFTVEEMLQIILEIYKNMNWVISILSAILIGAFYGGIAGNAMLPRNKNNKIIQNRMIRYTIVCIVLLSCNFLFSFWHGVVAIVLGYFIQTITGSQIKE